jgi:hypothetical protein
MQQLQRFMHESSLCLIVVVVSCVCCTNAPTNEAMFSSHVLSVNKNICMNEYIYIQTNKGVLAHDTNRSARGSNRIFMKNVTKTNENQRKTWTVLPLQRGVLPSRQPPGPREQGATQDDCVVMAAV